MESNVVLITGSSSGIGLATAKLFARKGWTVAATMRTPKMPDELQNFQNVHLFALDVRAEGMTAGCIRAVLERFGHIDVLINNAGYAALGIFEKSSPEEVKLQYETNVFGLMNTTRDILPHFRQRGRGTIVNVASVGGRCSFPLYSVYNSTKWAVDGFSEGLHYELAPLGIRVKCIEPGAIRTDFYTRSQAVFTREGITGYGNYEEVCLANMHQFGMLMDHKNKVARTIYKASVSKSNRLRYPVGGLAPIILFFRWLLPYSVNSWFMRQVVERGYHKQKP